MTLGAGDIVDAAEGRTVGRRFSKRSIIFRRKKRVDSRGSLLALRGENDIKNKRFMDQNNLQLKFPQNTETNTISALDPSFSKITKEFLYKGPGARAGSLP